MKDPEMLSVVFAAQSGYARSGERDLEQALIDLPVDRAGQQERDLKALVLNEAIETLPKLTNVQRRALAVCFILRNVGYVSLDSIDDFYSNMAHCRAALDIGSLKRADLQYLQAAGAGSLGLSSAPLAMCLASNALGYYTTGFTADDIPEVLRPWAEDQEVFVACLRDGTKLQINAASDRAVRDLEERKAIASPVLQNFSRIGVMNHDDILAEIVKRVPESAVAVERWEQSGLVNFELTAAGMAIGHAYWRQIMPNGASAPLDVWLSD